jgi:hypothetical protein
VFEGYELLIKWKYYCVEGMGRNYLCTTAVCTAGSCEHSHEPSGSIKDREFLV